MSTTQIGIVDFMPVFFPCHLQSVISENSRFFACYFQNSSQF